MTSGKILDMREAIRSATKYVCRTEDLDKLLPWGEDGSPDLRGEFQALFPDPSTGDKRAWRMYYKGATPKEFLARFGIDFDKPTVRAAVAFDLVKLDDGSVSNDSIYTYPERIGCSPLEYERFLLNRNFRINLVNLQPEWSNIRQIGSDIPLVRRTIDRVYQGVRLSETLLGYFNNIFNHSGEDIGAMYCPVTTHLDFVPEVSLIPNTHKDFKSITSRAYYDRKYIEYKRLLRGYGINAISTFALVDQNQDKNHTGQFLVKVQRKISDSIFDYIVLKMDKDGQILETPVEFTSGGDSILCVCEQDYLEKSGNPSETEIWEPVTMDVPMVKSTTSSHYSIFRQRIPDYDLKHVRHYFQYKTRLEGMELCLEQLERDIHSKEVHAGECFAQETLAIQRLFAELTSNRELMELVTKYYDYVAKFDQIVVKQTQLKGMRDEKQALLDDLIRQYNALDIDPDTGERYATNVDRNLDKKLQLGHDISSLKLELNRSLKSAIDELEVKKQEIMGAVRELNDQIEKIQDRTEKIPENASEILAKLKYDFSDAQDSILSKAKSDIQKMVQDSMGGMDSSIDFGDMGASASEKIDLETQQTIHELQEDVDGYGKEDSDGELHERTTHERPDPLAHINTTRLKSLVRSTQRWSGFMYNLGWELTQLREMQKVCEDATIEVRRLVHNFKEKMENVEADVWDSSHALRDDFSFTGIASSILREIILLHDWYAANAPGKTYAEMGFKDSDEFMDFRKRCNKIAYNLRKNQYAQMLAMKKHRIEGQIQDMRDKIDDADVLKYDDKYGADGKTKELPEWSLADVTKAQADRISVFASVEKVLAENEKGNRQYEKDRVSMKDRTVDYLKDIGLIESEADMEGLAIRNRVVQFQGDASAEIRALEEAKRNLDSANELLQRKRKALDFILNKVYNAEQEIARLETENKRIFSVCLTERNKQLRNRLLLDKLENENRILELKGVVKKTKLENLSDLSGLENLRKTADERQKEYNKAVARFKENIGLNQETIDNLVVSIYNKYQEEILNGDK